MEAEIKTANWSLFSRNYFDVAKSAMFLLLGTLAIMVFGDTKGAEVAIAVIIISSGLYSVLAGDDALRILDGLRADINDDEKNTTFIKALQSSRFMFFRVVHSLVFIAVVITQLMVLF